MIDGKLLDLYANVGQLIGFCYEKHKTNFDKSEADSCEEYLYDQGEYELALDEFEAILRLHKIQIDKECAAKLKEARNLMGKL